MRNECKRGVCEWILMLDTSLCPKTPADHRNEESAAGDENQLILCTLIHTFLIYCWGSMLSQVQEMSFDRNGKVLGHD